MEVEYSAKHRGRAGVWGTKLINEENINIEVEKIKLHSFNIELRRIVEKHPNNDIIIKIDTEGSEYDIFENIDKQLLNPVKVIMLEWHINGPDFIQDILEEIGFKILSLSPKSKKTGMLYAFK